MTVYYYIRGASACIPIVCTIITKLVKRHALYLHCMWIQYIIYKNYNAYIDPCRTLVRVNHILIIPHTWLEGNPWIDEMQIERGHAYPPHSSSSPSECLL